MTTYLIDTPTGPIYPATAAALAARFPHVSFPATIDWQALAAAGTYGVHPVVPIPPPDRPSDLHRLREGTPQRMNDQWLQTWIIDPPLVPESITRRQLLLALVATGRVTAEDAIAAARTGAIPPPIAAVFDALPPTDAIAAAITWATMTSVYRADPLIDAIIAADLATPAQINELFALGATL